MTDTGSEQTPLAPGFPDGAWLEQVALRYLARFEASHERVRRLLRTKLKRRRAAGQINEAEFEAGCAAVEGVLARLAAVQLLDDDRFARVRVQSLHRKGRSLCAIRKALHEGGIAPEAVTAALTDAFAKEDIPPDVRAAAIYCRRRRLGPFRPCAQRQALRLRDLAALVRAGFGIPVARQVIDAATTDEVDTWALLAR
ncbi:MAG: hypothetical protein FD149_640 [Rhodospirillaceae bacterium]|nr:MAG: hypothetical protein FD149_640 [Rhodospirillaceae bacterium]